MEFISQGILSLPPMNFLFSRKKKLFFGRSINFLRTNLRTVFWKKCWFSLMSRDQHSTIISCLLGEIIVKILPPPPPSLAQQQKQPSVIQKQAILNAFEGWCKTHWGQRFAFSNTFFWVIGTISFLLESKISVFLRGVEEGRLMTLKCGVASIMLNSGWAAHHLKRGQVSVERKAIESEKPKSREMVDSCLENNSKDSAQS